MLGGAASKFREIADLGAGVMSGAEGAAGATNGIEKTGNRLGTRSLQGKSKSTTTTKKQILRGSKRLRQSWFSALKERTSWILWLLMKPRS